MLAEVYDPYIHVQTRISGKFFAKLRALCFSTASLSITCKYSVNSMKLYVGFESTWSLRALICAEIAGVEIECVVLPLEGEGFKPKLISLTGTGLVPALDTGTVIVSDSLAIAEYFNEISNGLLFPEQQLERAVARSMVSELHSGFGLVRANCPFSSVGVEPLETTTFIESELDRIEAIFSKAQAKFMFAKPSIVDAFYSILAYRLQSYGITFNGKAGEYQRSLVGWSCLKQAVQKNTEWGVMLNKAFNAKL